MEKYINYGGQPKKIEDCYTYQQFAKAHRWTMSFLRSSDLATFEMIS